MSDPRYAPPRSEVVGPRIDAPLEVPEEILKKIRHAAVAGQVSAGITALVVLAAVFGLRVPGFDAWAFIDVALILGLAYGIHRKSRICALLMLAYFIGSKIFMFVNFRQGSTGLLFSLIFVYFYVQGVIGTFAYHRHVARERQPAQSP